MLVEESSYAQHNKRITWVSGLLLTCWILILRLDERFCMINNDTTTIIASSHVRDFIMLKATLKFNRIIFRSGIFVLIYKKFWAKHQNNILLRFDNAAKSSSGASLYLKKFIYFSTTYYITMIFSLNMEFILRFLLKT